MYKILVLILATSALFGCDETESKHWTVVRIQVEDDVTKSPIEDVFCGVFTQGSGLNSSTEELHVSNTVAGTFEFGFKAKKNKTYWAEATYVTEKYFQVSFSSFMNLNNGTDNEFQMSLVPNAYLSTKITNTSCFDANDEIIIYRPNLDVPSYNGYPANPDPYYGCYDNTSSYVKIPSGRYAFEWHVTKNSSTNVFYDTLTLGAGDSVLYEINY